MKKPAPQAVAALPRKQKRRAVEHWSQRIDFTFRPTMAVWRRFINYYRMLEDEHMFDGARPPEPKNTLIELALNEWLDRAERKKH